MEVLRFHEPFQLQWIELRSTSLQPALVTFTRTEPHAHLGPLLVFPLGPGIFLRYEPPQPFYFPSGQGLVMETEGPPCLLSYGGLLGVARAPVVVYDGQLHYLDPGDRPAPADDADESVPPATPEYAKTGALDDLLSS